MADDKDLKNLTYSIQFDSDDDPLKKITDKEKDIDDGFKKIGETVEKTDNGIKGVSETIGETANSTNKANESSKGILETLMNIFGIEEKTTNETKTLSETIANISKKGEDGINGIVDSLSKVGDIGSKVGTTMADIVNKANSGIDNAGNKITSSITSIGEKMGIIKKASDEDIEALQKADTYFEYISEKASIHSRITRDLNDQYTKLVEKLGYTNDETEKFKMKLINAQLEEQKLNEQVDKAGEALSIAQDKVEGVANGFNKADEASKKLDESTKRVSSGIGSMLAAFGFMGVAFTVADGIKGATKAYADFEQEMATVHATLGQVSNNDMTALSNKAIETSNKYGISSLEVSQGEEELASHGLNAKQILDTIQPSVLLSVAGNIKMKDSTLDVSAALRNFNMDMSKAAHVSDVYAQAAASTAATMPDMAEALKNVSPLAGELGISIENTSAAIGVLADRGIKGGTAGTDLKIMLERLVNPVGKAKTLLQELGFNAMDPTTHKMKDFGTIVRDLSKAMGDHGLNNELAKSAAISTIFGKEAVPGISALFSTGAQKIDSLTKSLKNSDGAAQKMTITMNDTLSGALRKLKSNVENAFITDIYKTGLGKTLKEFVIDINKNLPSISKTINTALQDIMKFASFIKTNWSTLAPIIVTVASAYAGLKAVGTIGGIVKNVEALGKAATPMSGFALALSLAAGAFVAFKQGNTGMGIVLSGLAAGIGYVSFAMGVLDVVSWPVVAVIGAITLAVLGAYEVYKHWSEIHQELINKLQLLELTAAVVWDSITKSLQGYVNTWVGYLNDLLWPLNEVIKGINFISGAKIPELTVPKANFATNTAAGVAKDIKKSQGPEPNLTGNKFMLTPKFAEGTNFAPGGVSLVGEKGPELVNLPRGAKVTPNNLLTSALQNNSNLNFSSAINQYDKQVTKMKPIFTQYGQQLNTNLGGGISQSQEQVVNPTNSTVNTVGTKLQNFVNQSREYGSGIDSEIAAGLQDKMKDVTDMVTQLTNKVIDTFKQGFGIHSPSRVFYNLTKFIPQGMINALNDSDMDTFIKSWVGNISSSAGSAMGGNVSQWLSAALALTGTPMDWLGGLLKLVSAESGGSPTEVNNIPVGGEYATGLLQTLPSTFREFMQPGLGDIMNPIDNAASAINYIKSRYGTVFNTPLFKGGTYSGYATGTSSATTGPHWIGEHGRELMWMHGGEKIMPHTQSEQMMANRSYVNNNHTTSNSITIKPQIDIHIDGTNKNGKEIAQEVKKMFEQKFGDMFDDKMADLIRVLGL